ncbi:Arc family DNA-binding protein [Acidovorax sp. A1169]|uniref:Arc family DNA-binding protein n=1 Tax=Acidovorax sp. A1169 TaxID=3059524 RepID=UPI002737925A|nr:Arc family DNA-binding protein [Acidovorax sp. A1169]MDP4076247.1 Arc family DNA-binding protein [Acidovorax sp. A1169]
MDNKQPQDTESRHADKYIVRFPDGMRDRLKAAAKYNNRTLNAEIVARLEGSFRSVDVNDAAAIMLDLHRAEDKLAARNPAKDWAVIADLIHNLQQQQAMTAEQVKKLADAFESGDVTLVHKGTVKVPKLKTKASQP